MSAKKTLIIAAAAILPFFAASSSRSGEDAVYPGDWTNYHRGLTDKDLSFRPEYKDKYANEGLYIQIRFDDGTFMFGSFFIYKAGPYWRYGIMFSHVDLDGKRRLFKEEVPDKGVERSGPPFRWRLNNNVIDGDGDDWRMVLKSGELDADLRFKRLTPGWKPGDGTTVLNEEKTLYFYNVIMVPAARVSGSIRIAGKEYLSNGYGYIDRVYQNPVFTHYSPVALSTYAMPVPDAAPDDRWFFYFTDNYGHKTFNEIRYRWLILIRNDRIIFATKDFTTSQEDWRVDPSINEKTPFRYVIKGRQRDDRIQLVVQGDRIVDSLDVFSELPLYVRKVAKKFLNRPVYFRINSTVTGKVLIDGKTIPFKALGMSGSVYFR